MMTRRECLIAARKKIQDPEHWTQGTFARDEVDRDVEPESSAACKWCAVGVLFSVCKENGVVLWAELDLTSTELYGRGIAAVNDRYGDSCHLRVLRVYDLCIARAT